MAGPEKALMDMLYLRKMISFKSEFEMNGISRKKLATIAEKYPQSTRNLLIPALLYGCHFAFA
jgi:hypothetical protein